MNAKATVEAVVFDMDGLLLDTERLHQKAYGLALSDMALPADPQLFLDLIGLNETAGDSVLRQRLPRHLDMRHFKSVWADHFASMIADHVPLKTGVGHLLHLLELKGTPMIVATSTKRVAAESLLQKAAILDRFALLICGDEVVNGKPAPDIYLAAASALGKQPTSCVAFEDSSNGVRAAVAAGLVTVQVPDLVAPPADVIALGHVIASDILVGARRVGCL